MILCTSDHRAPKEGAVKGVDKTKEKDGRTMKKGLGGSQGNQILIKNNLVLFYNIIILDISLTFNIKTI